MHLSLKSKNISAADGLQCEKQEGSLKPQIFLFLIHAMAGFLGPLYDGLGTAYMDDNIQKSKTPLFLSASYCVRMFGPAIGYSLASFSLKYYIAPDLSPIIDSSDQRWLGAWWLGWIIIGISLTLFSFLLSLFPRELPRAQLRRLISAEEKRILDSKNPIVEEEKYGNKRDEMIKTFKRVLTNKILMLNTFASVFYIFGFIPYWTFMAKYIETQYRMSASASRYRYFWF